MPQRYKIVIEYDGSALVGWQKQFEGDSVQGFLEKAIFAFCQQEVEVYGAGRTDAGVHAFAQVAHFDLEFAKDEFRIREGLNAHLRNLRAPVAVLDVSAAEPSFHARFSAVRRNYIYKICNRKAPLILEANRKWWLNYPLDVEKMYLGAEFLLGCHDFTSFRALKCQAKSPIRTLEKVEITQNGEDISIFVEAKSFLHHQVRNIVGTLKLVGDGTLEPKDVEAILAAKDRAKAGPTAPACGLYLNQIFY